MKRTASVIIVLTLVSVGFSVSFSDTAEAAFIESVAVPWDTNFIPNDSAWDSTGNYCLVVGEDTASTPDENAWAYNSVNGSWKKVGSEAAPSGGATTFYVGSGAGNDSATIQGAINAASPGDTVFVWPGVYYENVIVNKAINLTGASKSGTEINANNVGDVLTVTANWANISTLTVTGSGPGCMGVNLVFVSYCTVSRLNVENSYLGIYLEGSCDNLIGRNNISYCSNDGIFLESGSNNNVIRLNDIYSNPNGLSIDGGDGNKIYHNNFIFNTNQAYDAGSNTWNMLGENEGNYWSDWTSPDANGDMIVDSPHMITGGAQDLYPFTLDDGWNLERGSGTVEDPFMVYDVWQLQAMQNNLTAHYALGNDIDAAITSGWNSGAGFEPIGFVFPASFKGSLNGRGHVITGLKITRSSTNNAVGLFGSMDVGSAVFDLGVVAADIRGGTYGTAALVGYSVGTVSRCYSTGAMVGTSFAYTGGLIGSLASGGSVTDSYSTASVTGGTDIGGFIGRAWSYVARCYSTGSVGTGTNRGGFAGSNYDTILNCFYDSQTSGMTDTGKGEPRTTVQMKTQATFTGWNFTHTWSIQEGVTYPQLRQPIFAGGIGTKDSPFLIGDSVQLQAVRNNLAAHYRLANDIDASVTSTWNGGAGFIPIGTMGTPFTGSFDGANHMITGLRINRPALDYVGLFGRLGPTGKVGNATLTGVSVTGYSFTGGLVGCNDEGFVGNSSCSGTVNGYIEVGGLVGLNFGTIIKSYSTADVTASNNEVGGLVGFISWNSYVQECYATGDVSGSQYVGGLVGWSSQGNIYNSYATGSVTASTNSAGGLVGASDNGLVYTSYSTGHVSCPGGEVGGFMGRDTSSDVNGNFWDTETSGMATSSGAIGLTTAQMVMQSNLPGFDFTNVWWSLDRQTRPFLRMEWSEDIRNGHQVQMMSMNLTANYTLLNDVDLSEITAPAQMWGTSPTTGDGFMPVGQSALLKFKGSLEGNGHSIGNLYIKRTSDYVGLFGYNIGSVYNVTMGQVYASGNLAVGGLVGSNAGLVRGCSVSGAIISSGANTGGVVGYNNLGTIERCIGTASVTSTANNAGGIVGYNYGQVSESCASGHITGFDNIGGLAGYLYSSNVNNCYAEGDANGNSKIGGLVGYIFGTGSVSNSYSTGTVTGNIDLGGLIGLSVGSVAFSFWDMETSGMAVSSGGTGLTTAQMKTQAQFISAGWDFVDIWHMQETITYPLFTWQPFPSSGGELFPALNSVAWDWVNGRFLVCGEAGGSSTVYCVYPNNLGTIVPIPNAPDYAFNAIAPDAFGNILVGGNSLPGLYYYDSSGNNWITIPESLSGSMAQWNITGIDMNGDDRFFAVGNWAGQNKGACFFTDVTELGLGSLCYRDMSDFMNSPGIGSLRALDWNDWHYYGLAVGEGVYRVDNYDGNPGNELQWAAIGEPTGGNGFYDVSWDSDGWNEAGIVGNNQTSGNYWRYYNTNPQLIQGYKDPVSGTKYRTCAMKPPSSPKWLFIPHAGGGIRVGIMEKDESSVITLDINFPHIFTVDMWKQNDPARISRLNSQVEADSTYTFFIEGNYTREGVSFWNSLEIELAAWFDFGNPASSPDDPTWSTDNHRTSQFNVSYNGPSGNTNMNYPTPLAPAGEEFSVLSYWQDPGNYGADGNTHRLYMNITFGPQTIMAPGQGPMTPPANTWDKNFALNDRFTWDFRVLMYDTASTSSLNMSYDEFGVQRYASISVSGSPAASIPPGATDLLATPSVLMYSSNAQYKLNVSIPHLYKNGNPVLNYISAGYVRVLNNHSNANAANSNISSWQQFNGEDQDQIIWGTESTWIQPVGSGTVSSGPMYSDYTAAMVPETFEVTRIWWSVEVPVGTPEGVYRATITITLWT